MAKIEKVVEIKVISEQAEKNISDINSVIDEQRAILVLLEEEYIKAKQALDDYNKSGEVNLSQEKQLKENLSERKAALDDQRLGLKKLAIQQREANSEAKKFREEQKETTNIVRAIDKLTGGFATKIVKLTKGFKSGVKGIKSFIVGLSGVKKALLATGIGALVVLVGSLVANFDKIKSALFGISKESIKVADAAKETADESLNQLNNLQSSENILKLQGKSEKEILQLKKQQTNEAITALESQLEAQKTVRKLQIDTAERNKKILKGILDFVLRPIVRIAKAIDSIGKKFGKDFGLADTVGDLGGSIAGQLFSGFDEEGDKAIKDTEKKLLQLKNRRDGFILQQNKDKEAERQAEEDAFFEEMFAIEEREDQKRERREKKEEEERIKQEELKLQQIEKDKQLNELLAENEFKLQQAKISAFQGGFDILSKLAGKNKSLQAGLLVVEKGLAIAQVVSNAARAIAQAKANLAATPAVIGLAPNPMYVKQAIATAKGIIATKTAAATSIATIAAQAIPGQGGGGGGAASVSSLGTGGGTESQPPSFNIVGASETNQLAEAVAGQEQQPVQAYVVSNDVTTAQSLENNIVEGATLG